MCKIMLNAFHLTVFLYLGIRGYEDIYKCDLVTMQWKCSATICKHCVKEYTISLARVFV